MEHRGKEFYSSTERSENTFFAFFHHFLFLYATIEANNCKELRIIETRLEK